MYTVWIQCNLTAMSRSWAHKFLCHYDLTAMSRSWAHKFLFHYDFTVMSRSWAHKFLCHYDVTVMSHSWAHNSDVTMSSQWCHPHDITSMTCVWTHCELTWHHFTTGMAVPTVSWLKFFLWHWYSVKCSQALHLLYSTFSFF